MREKSAKLDRGLRNVAVHFLGSAECNIILRILRTIVAAFGDRAKCCGVFKKARSAVHSAASYFGKC
jgi:hypothetical protein